MSAPARTGSSTLALPTRLREELLAHARDGAPLEVCGVLAGELDDYHSRVEALHRADNAADSPRTRYAMDPEQQYAILQAIDDAGRDVVGFYHSHPRGPPGPSGVDHDRASWPGRSYVIAVLDPDDPGVGTVGSWRWTGERFEREEVVVDEE